MRAIETRWRGFRFRSRTEARWAVFLDAYGAAWEYEPETVRLPNGRLYLPDFRVRLCGREFWLEVKPAIGCVDEEMEGPRHVGAYMAYGEPQPFLPLHWAKCEATSARQWCKGPGDSGDCFCLNDRYEYRTWSVNESAALSIDDTDAERWDWCGPLARKAIEAARRERFGAHE